MKQTKKIIAMLLVAVMALSLLPMTSFAEEKKVLDFAVVKKTIITKLHLQLSKAFKMIGKS